MNTTISSNTCSVGWLEELGFSGVVRTARGGWRKHARRNLVPGYEGEGGCPHERCCTMFGCTPLPTACLPTFAGMSC